jgi:hypothetical protein
MFTRILTDFERKHIRAYLRQDGEKKIQVRKVVYGARKHLPTIRSDLELLEELLRAYAVE